MGWSWRSLKWATLGTCAPGVLTPCPRATLCTLLVANSSNGLQWSRPNPQSIRMQTNQAVTSLGPWERSQNTFGAGNFFGHSKGHLWKPWASHHADGYPWAIPTCRRPKGQVWTDSICTKFLSIHCTNLSVLLLSGQTLGMVVLSNHTPKRVTFSNFWHPTKRIKLCSSLNWMGFHYNFAVSAGTFRLSYSIMS